MQYRPQKGFLKNTHRVGSEILRHITSLTVKCGQHFRIQAQRSWHDKLLGTHYKGSRIGARQRLVQNLNESGLAGANGSKLYHVTKSRGFQPYREESQEHDSSD